MSIDIIVIPRIAPTVTAYFCGVFDTSCTFLEKAGTDFALEVRAL
jgi:hypothetical protein